MESRAHALAAGLFVVLLIALLSATAVWLGGPHFRGLPYDLITERSVAGLTPGASVRLRGVEVGRVDGIGFDPQNRRHVRVRIQVDAHNPLLVGTYATLASLGLSGNEYIELSYPDDATQILATSEQAPAHIPMGASGFAVLTESGDELLKSLKGTLGRVDAVLAPENVQHISELIARFDTAAGQISELTHNLVPATRRLDGLLVDVDRAVNSAQTTLGDADSLIIQVRGRVGALDALRDAARNAGQSVQTLQQSLTTETLPQIESLTQRLSRNSDTLEGLLRQLSDQPQSVIFGLPPNPPGPGEPKFRSAHK
jgi:phospholipid/cholesterol/gamma-HCH transport system substrate-binding protein